MVAGAGYLNTFHVRTYALKLHNNLMNEALNPRQDRFVDEYLLDGNGTQAAIKAGYSPKTAAT